MKPRDIQGTTSSNACTELDRRKWMKDVHTIAVKIGSSVLMDDKGRLEPEMFAQIARQVSTLMSNGHNVVLISSGAILAGRAKMRLTMDRDSIPVKQAMAAVGQSDIIRFYEQFFTHYGFVVAQVLLTRNDLENRRRYLNARHTLMCLMDMKVVPIINENDTVMVDEIHFGDNDNLAAMVTPLVDADLLIILSDVSGLFDGDPALGKGVCIIPVVDRVDERIEHLAGGARPGLGLGGMITKVNAAKRAARYGVPTVVADGKERDVILHIVRGENIGTIFLPQEDRLTSRKHWIAYTLKSRGDVVLDSGAVEALVKGGKSLLPSGILEVRGTFAKGELVVCLTREGKAMARGLVNYSSSEIDRIKGMHSSRIQDILGFKVTDEIIHRDNMVLS